MIKKLIAYLRRPKCPNIPKYFCADCIHSDMHWSDNLIFRGFSCRINAR